MRARGLVSILTAAVLCLGAISLGDGRLGAVAADYYDPITAAGGEELLGQLHDLITTTHTRYTTYADCRDYGHTTDYAEGGTMSIIEFYTHETIVEYTQNGGDAGRWNREHVWPKACSNDLWKKISNPESGGGADLHHIRPTEVKMNSAREADKYGEAPNGSPVYSKTISGADSQIGGYHAGGVFEPLDNVKGDVARILFYVYTHYNTYSNVHGTTNGGGRSSYFGTLPITNVIAAPSEDEAFGLLLEWNALDPVDDIETTRNEAVFSIQNNRNPFIDHPEYADAIWGDPSLPPDGGDPDDKDPDDGKDPDNKDPEDREPDVDDPAGKEPDSKEPDDGGEGEPSDPAADGCGGTVGVAGAALVLASAAALVGRRKE